MNTKKLIIKPDSAITFHAEPVHHIIYNGKKIFPITFELFDAFSKMAEKEQYRKRTYNLSHICFRLYLHCLFTSIEQKENPIRATNDYLMKGMDVAEEVLYEAKAIMQESGFITYTKAKKTNGDNPLSIQSPLTDPQIVSYFPFNIEKYELFYARSQQEYNKFRYYNTAWDALIIYFQYMRKGIMSDTNQPYATNSYVTRKTALSKKRVSDARNLLLELDLISEIQKHDKIYTKTITIYQLGALDIEKISIPETGSNTENALNTRHEENRVEETHPNKESHHTGSRVSLMPVLVIPPYRFSYVHHTGSRDPILNGISKTQPKEVGGLRNKEIKTGVKDLKVVRAPKTFFGSLFKRVEEETEEISLKNSQKEKEYKSLENSLEEEDKKEDKFLESSIKEREEKENNLLEFPKKDKISKNFSADEVIQKKLNNGGDNDMIKITEDFKGFCEDTFGKLDGSIIYNFYNHFFNPSQFRKMGAIKQMSKDDKITNIKFILETTTKEMFLECVLKFQRELTNGTVKTHNIKYFTEAAKNYTLQQNKYEKKLKEKAKAKEHSGVILPIRDTQNRNREDVKNEAHMYNYKCNECGGNISYESYKCPKSHKIIFWTDEHKVGWRSSTIEMHEKLRLGLL